MRKLVLASSSPRRREILARTGLKFIVDPASIPEDMGRKLRPSELVKRLSFEKASAVATRHHSAIVIGADTIVALGDKVWSKPDDLAHAKRMLRSLSGKAHDVWTGFAIIDTKTGDSVVRAVRTKVHFRKLSEADIRTYLARGESLDVAGGYAIQLGGSVLSEKIVGDYNNIVGLPLAAVLEELEKFGVKVQ